MSTPGTALLALEELRRHTETLRIAADAAASARRVARDVADLKAIARIFGLPVVSIKGNSRFGTTGTVLGSDVEQAVREWAEAFGVKAVVVEPSQRMTRKGVVVEPGYAVMHGAVGSLRFTVGGRLHEDGAR